jgi:PAS domain-containing protein
MITESHVAATLTALSRTRQTVSARASQLLSTVSHEPEDEPTVAGLTALLMASLEELRLAEEELREQNDALLLRQIEVDEMVRHYRQLFEQSPTAALLTDAFGTILECNRAAERLFRRQEPFLVKKPFASLLAPVRREEFRAGLRRLDVVRSVRSWPIVVNRGDDTSATLQADIEVLPRAMHGPGEVLYWQLRELSS